MDGTAEEENQDRTGQGAESHVTIGIIFDFNGTCLFDRKFHDEAWRRYIGELTMKEPSESEVSAFITGHTEKEILEHFTGYSLTDSMVRQFTDEKERIYRVLIRRENLSLAPGLETFLDYLKAAGIPRAIATTANLENMNFYYDRFQLSRWFSWDRIIIGAGNIPLKPHPDLYLAAVGKIGLPAGQCVAFEDSDSGVQAAWGAGIRHIIGVTGDSWNTGLRNLPGVYAVIHDFTELNRENFA